MCMIWFALVSSVNWSMLGGVLKQRVGLFSSSLTAAAPMRGVQLWCTLKLLTLQLLVLKGSLKEKKERPAKAANLEAIPEFTRVTSVESNRTLQDHTNSVESCHRAHDPKESASASRSKSASHQNLRLQDSTPRPHLQLFGSMSSKHLSNIQIESPNFIATFLKIMFLWWSWHALLLFRMVPVSGNSIRSGSRQTFE